MFLEISQNSQKSTCARVSFLMKLTLLKKRPWHRCFPVNFAKFLRTTFYTEHFWRLLLKVLLRFSHFLNQLINTNLSVNMEEQFWRVFAPKNTRNTYWVLCNSRFHFKNFIFVICLQKQNISYAFFFLKPIWR